MQKLIKREEFLKKYNIEPNKFNDTTLKWKELEEIYIDYQKEIPNLEESAIYIFNRLMKQPHVNSVRYRVKDSEHVIEKIIRKKIKNNERVINIENYKSELTDLIGIRVLHLFKNEWIQIHELILNNWETKETPTAFYREGDSPDYNKQYEELDCKIEKHERGYRSIHYVIETKPTKVAYFAEIQVRTIFEEAWSEIDHKISYPYDINNVLFSQFLMILNRLAGSADEMGSYIQLLKIEIAEREINYKIELDTRDTTIKELEENLKRLNLKEEDYKHISETINILKKPITTISQNFISDLMGNYGFANIANSTINALNEQFYNNTMKSFGTLNANSIIETVNLVNPYKTTNEIFKNLNLDKKEKEE